MLKHVVLELAFIAKELVSLTSSSFTAIALLLTSSLLV